jgi:transposase-like protein
MSNVTARGAGPRRSDLASDPAKRRRVVAAYRAGSLSVQEIARAHGVSETLIRSILLEEGVEIYKRRN